MNSTAKRTINKAMNSTAKRTINKAMNCTVIKYNK